jgi:hypothetical protein
VIVARASERVTPEGLEPIYGSALWAFPAELRRLIADGVLEPGTLGPINPIINLMTRRKTEARSPPLMNDSRSQGARL